MSRRVLLSRTPTFLVRRRSISQTVHYTLASSTLKLVHFELVSVKFFLIFFQAKIKTELQETKEKLSAKDCELKKARRQIESLTDDVNALKGIRRFDPKKAFQTRAEN